MVKSTFYLNLRIILASAALGLLYTSIPAPAQSSNKNASATDQMARLSNPQDYIVQPELPLLSRMGLWDGVQFNQMTTPGGVARDHVYVLVHGCWFCFSMTGFTFPPRPCF